MYFPLNERNVHIEDFETSFKKYFCGSSKVFFICLGCVHDNFFEFFFLNFFATVYLDIYHTQNRK